MRNEAEMRSLLLSVAEQDDRVRAVILNGSRANPSVKRDRFQDFDIVYFVTEVTSFLREPDWIDVFGERIVMQTPETSVLVPPEGDGHFTYLMLFTDGNRIDLSLYPLDRIPDCCADSLTVPLLDKDGLLPALPPPSDRDYRIKRPNAALFRDCCNEFWWTAPYVAKSLWRDQLPYAQHHLGECTRAMLEQMLTWQIGFATDFAVGAGAYGKYLKQHLAPAEWAAYCSTFAGGTVENCWDALFAAASLFRRSARKVAASLEAPYNEDEDSKVTAYLQWVRALPPD